MSILSTWFDECSVSVKGVGFRTETEPNGGLGSLPPRVTRGTKCQTRVDTLTATVPDALVDRVRQLVVKLMGRPPEPGQQLRWYNASERWSDGLVLASDQKGGGSTAMLQMRGAECSAVEPDLLVEFIADLRELGARITRLDVAVDFHDVDGVGLIAQAHSACERFELCRARQWEMRQPRLAHGDSLGATLYMGTRGKDGSGRYVRVYDKGLETGEAPAGQWERWEVEFSKDCADQAAAQIVAAWRSGLGDSSGAWARCAAGLAFGAVDFRVFLETDSGDLVRLSRRPVAQWWADLLQHLPVIVVRARRQLSTLKGYASWVVRAAASRLVRLQRRTGMLLEDIVSELERVAGCSIVDRGRESVVEREFLELLGAAR